jgi:carboxypeptidase PM20D1
MIRKVGLGFLLAIAVLIAAVALNTFRQGSRQLDVAPVMPVAVNTTAAAQRLTGAVRLRTISYRDQPDANAEEFLKLHDHLTKHYPTVHTVLKREVVGGRSLLYTWQGSEAAARPIMLMAHQDVVPIAPGTKADWRVEPFSGEIRDGFVWGRGAWDDKGNLCAIMEAVELLLVQGFRPRQTIYLALGHDEETGGVRGAAVIAALLQSRGVRLKFVLDEGLIITEGVLKGLDKPVALIGTAEKGFLTLALSTTAQAGHSSMPPSRTTIGTLSEALVRLEHKQMPAAIRGVTKEMFETLAPEMQGFNRVLLSNLWLFGPLVKSQIEKTPSTDAMLRTTTALTVIHAGEKDNVLPGWADALVNFRLLPGDTYEHVVDHVKNTVANEAVKIAPSTPFSSEASPISPTDSVSYQLINRTIRELFPGTVVAPGLMIGGTDSRHMSAITDGVYRFSPVRARSEDLPRFHGTNERISVDNYAELIRFYHRLLTNASGATPTGQAQ